MPDSNTPAQALSFLAKRHLEKTRKHYNDRGPELLWPARCYRRWLAHYYNLLIPDNASVLEIGCGSGELLAMLSSRHLSGVDIAENQISAAKNLVPEANLFVQSGEELQLKETFDYIILSDTLNLAADAQLLLESALRAASPSTRLIINFPSSLWRPIYALATRLGIRADHPQSSWLTSSDVRNLLYLSGWEAIKFDARILLPWAPGSLDIIANRWLSPFCSWFCLAVFCTARPHSKRAAECKVSVIVPARNEAGNIEEVVRRIPHLGTETEIILIEGHSKDNTAAEIQRVRGAYSHRDIKIMRQSGEGKGNAVREAFAASKGDILIILDADLTVPPEELPKFIETLVSGRGEFANGVRLVYPMEKEAMRFMNLCANKFFSLAFSWLLGQPIKDTLCGTKALRKSHYIQISENRAYFGDFDPFGDFDLLFGANKISLKIVDVPIRYQGRIYGTTNIRRWSHGWLLIRMLVFAARKLKFV